ncbi:MAG TPA: hypothetical protein VKA60_08725 [Blastocatellia bacterium]|nr:hypothetical protein [Blastocatellia bacterium]
MMSDVAETFKRYGQEHARLYDPELLESSAQLVSIEEETRGRPSGKAQAKKKGGKKVCGASSAPAPDSSGLDANDPLELERWLPAVYRPPFVQVTDDDLDVADLASTAPAEPAAEAGPPAVALAPSQIRRQICLFQEQSFAINAPDAQKVFMLWSRQPRNALRRVEMDHQRDGLFTATIGIEDGDYLLAYEANGVTRPDPRYARKLVVRPGGVYARLELWRNLVRCTVANEGEEDETLRMRPTAAWLAAEDELRLPAGQATSTDVRLLPEHMAVGHNSGALLTLRDGENLPAASLQADVWLEVGGAIPEFRYHPQELGWILQGGGQVEFSVEICARGRGPLKGMVFLPNPGEVAEFRLEAGGEDDRFTRTFAIESAILPYKTEGQLKVVLITDSFLANHRFFEVALPYRLVYLKKSLPALAFGRVRQGMSRTLRLEVERSDGQEIDLQIAIPKAAANYLECYRARAGVYSLRLDTTRLAAGTAINETLNLSDRNSGLQDQIKVLADIVNEAARPAPRP